MSLNRNAPESFLPHPHQSCPVTAQSSLYVPARGVAAKDESSPDIHGGLQFLVFSRRWAFLPSQRHQPHPYTSESRRNRAQSSLVSDEDSHFLWRVFPAGLRLLR